MTMRVLVLRNGIETVWPCIRACRNADGVFLECKENVDVLVEEGKVLVLSDDGKCAHKWDLDYPKGRR